MTKKVLGRGLGELLPDFRPGAARHCSGSTTNSKGAQIDLGPGLKALLNQPGEGTRARKASLPQSARAPLLTVLSLVISDAVLLTLAALWSSELVGNGFRLWQIVVLLGVVSMGAWCSSLAVWLRRGNVGKGAVAESNRNSYMNSINTGTNGLMRPLNVARDKISAR